MPQEKTKKKFWKRKCIYRATYEFKYGKYVINKYTSKLTIYIHACVYVFICLCAMGERKNKRGGTVKVLKYKYQAHTYMHTNKRTHINPLIEWT